MLTDFEPVLHVISVLSNGASTFQSLTDSITERRQRLPPARCKDGRDRVDPINMILSTSNFSNWNGRRISKSLEDGAVIWKV